jgi:hypothetical protein
MHMKCSCFIVIGVKTRFCFKKNKSVYSVIIFGEKMTKYTQNEIIVQVQKVCHSLQLSLHHNWRGPKIYNQHQLIALLILKGRENKSLRRFVAWLHETKWPEWLGLKEIPSYSTIYRAIRRLGMSVLRRINDAIISVLKTTKAALDGTGINMHHRSRHYERRAKLDYLPNGKLDILANIEHFTINDWQFTVKERHDVYASKRIMRRQKCVHNVELWGDKGHDCEELHEIADAKGFVLLAPTRRSGRKRPKGRFRRKVDALIEAKGCYERPKVETVFSILKRVYGETIRAIEPYMKKREMAWKIIAMNTEKMIKAFALWFWFQTIRNRTEG